ncbi:MAG: hypothetical protein F4038_02630 [Chloroflexi bacterium]|nr:hypothetical protein [Chloroflexota bacterium]MYJ91935.1 hypothetical protein [Chloroflexota bacterium]
MNPAQRAKRLQAHSLRCQGLTYRQIGERMHCAHSTAAKYVRDFESHRSEIIESLAADLLVHSVANLQHPDPDLHQQHINAARELRLLVNSLDQVEDRRQKRARRIVMEQEADTIKYIEALDQLTATMRESGIDDFTPYLTDPEAFRTEHFTQPLPSPNPAEQDAASTPLSPRAAGGDAEGRGGSPALASPTTVNPTPTISVQQQPKPDHRPTKPAQNRPKSNKSERKSHNRPPVQAPPRPKRKKAHTQVLTPDPLPPPNNRRELAPDDPLVRRLFRNW